MRNLKVLFTLLVAVSVVSCTSEDPSFSLLPETDFFSQSKSSFTNKIDILWVIDNSGSMHNLQTNVANNFSAFINSFASRGYDFQIAVTTTEAWVADYNPSYADLAKFRNDSGHYILTPSTPDLETAFLQNIMQGTSGFGDERAFQSITAAFDSSLNDGFDFPRADAYLAIIIVSDEDDFSHDGTNYIAHNYSYPGLIPHTEYITYLDTLTSSTGALRRYNVSAIAIWDSVCEAANAPDGVIAQRYQELVLATEGIQGDVCASTFSDNLESISQQIAELSSQFYLSRQPIIGTIVVKVDGVLIPEDATNGWTYDSAANSIVFHGSSVPVEGASISIDFDPVDIIRE